MSFFSVMLPFIFVSDIITDLSLSVIGFLYSTITLNLKIINQWDFCFINENLSIILNHSNGGVQKGLRLNSMNLTGNSVRERNDRTNKFLKL